MLSTDSVVKVIAADADQGISDAKWDLTLSDIADWAGGVRTETGDVKKVGSIEFFENKAVDYRLDFRNRLRQRYGIYPLTSEIPSNNEPAFAVGVCSDRDWLCDG